MAKSEHLQKSTIITIVIISALFASVPLLVYQTQNPPKEKALAATLALTQFPGLDWSIPTKEKVSVLLEEKTEKEHLTLATGEKSQAISTTNISVEVFKYYNEQLLKKGFNRIKLVGNPNQENYWVADYQSGTQYAEIEYYPTPYKTDRFTVVLFFGVLPEETD